MHESSVAKEIVDIVLDVAKENQLTNVSSITIEVGEFSCIQQQMLTFAFQMIAENTILEHTNLQYEIVKATAICRHCNQAFPITFTNKTCPICHRVSEEIVTGLEANVKEIEGE